MRIEPRLVKKVALYAPEESFTNHLGDVIDIIPQGEIQWYITYDDGETIRAMFLESERLQNKRLLSYVPYSESRANFHSREGIVAMIADDAEFEHLEDTN